MFAMESKWWEIHRQYESGEISADKASVLLQEFRDQEWKAFEEKMTNGDESATRRS